MKKALRITLIITGSLLILIVLALIIGVAPLNRALDYKPLLDTMNARIDGVDVQVVPVAGGIQNWVQQSQSNTARTCCYSRLWKATGTTLRIRARLYLCAHFGYR